MTSEIPLTQGYVAIIDDDDADLADFKWYALIIIASDTLVYAARKPHKTANILIHRVIYSRILGRALERHEYIDHVNGNSLDNRRCNLRIANHTENMRNRRLNKNSTSGFKGVTRDKKSQKWAAKIYHNKKSQHLGLFDTPEAAHAAYVAAARELHGEFFNPGRTKPETSE